MPSKKPLKTDRKQAARKSIHKRIGSAIAKTAPQLAEALGGPLAGAAIGSIAEAIFGSPDTDMGLVEKAILAAHPETMLKLREAEYDFRKAVMDNQTALERVAMEDRSSARNRQAAMKDKAPTIIGAAVILGFFLVLSGMLLWELPAGAETEFSIMLGALATMTAAVVNYFFGSSAWSKEKTHMLVEQSTEHGRAQASGKI